MGRIAVIFPGVRPSIRLASSPTARTFDVPAWIATTDGSRRTIPLSRTYTSELAVPRSIPISLENRLLNCASMNVPNAQQIKCRYSNRSRVLEYLYTIGGWTWFQPPFITNLITTTITRGQDTV